LASSGAHVWPLERFRERAREDTVAAGDSVAFPELVWAHFLRQRELKETGNFHGGAETEYRTQLEAFAREQGPLLNAYWCTTEASAVALTEKAEGRAAGVLSHPKRTIRFHAATDWVTKDTPEIGHALHTCETLAIRISEVLRGTSQRIAMQWILSIAGYLLGVVDQAKGQPTRAVTAAACKRTRAELVKVEAYYDRAGDKAARLVYFRGMMLGLGAAVALAAFAALLVWAFGSLDVHSSRTQELSTSYAMGAIGAVVSVMIRMASASATAFKLDYEVGRASLQRLGSFRPFIGAIFAVVLYFALKGGLLQIRPASDKTPLYFYAAFAFIAGFSERWAKVILGGAERMLGGAGADDQHSRRSSPRTSGSQEASPTT
jgi:flagellar hook-basal body complex protein FliE